MRRIVLSSLDGKNLDTVSHTLLALLHNYRTRPADILHFHGMGNSLFLPLIQWMPGKTVVTVDGPDWERPKWGRIARRVLKLSALLAVRKADAIITDSQISQRYYRTHFNKETTYIPYGADTKQVSDKEALDRYGLRQRGYFLFVGRLVPDKGVHYLVQAFEGVKSNLDLVIVGDSPLFPDYVRQLKATSDPRIKFLGFVFGEPYRQLCAYAYAYVQPSFIEGTSPALLAAMGMGNCVIVNSIPENLETIGDAGLSYAYNDPQDLQRMLQLLGDQPRLVESYRAKAQQRVESSYNWDSISRQHEQVYHAVLRGFDASAPELAI